MKGLAPSAAIRADLSGSSKGSPAYALGDLRVTVRASLPGTSPRTSYSSRSEHPVRFPGDFAGPSHGAPSISFGAPSVDRMSIAASGDGFTFSEDEGAVGLSLGKAMSTMVVQERHLWLNLAEMKDADKARFLDAPISQAGLFGDTVEGFAQQFSAVQQQTEAIQHILPRRDAPSTAAPGAKPQSARRRGCPPASSRAAPPQAESTHRPARRASRRRAAPPTSQPGPKSSRKSIRPSEDEEQVLLVAPHWPTRTWFPELISLATAPPWRIPLRKDLLYYCICFIYTVHVHLCLCAVHIVDRRKAIALYLLLRRLRRRIRRRFWVPPGNGTAKNNNWP